MGHFFNEESNELLTTQTENLQQEIVTKTARPYRVKKNYDCSFEGCKATFKKPSRLEWHLRQHNGERPFKCGFENCDKAYTTSSHLKRHEQSHTRVTATLICDKCLKHFSNRQNLLKHFNRIHNSTRISCQECGKIFRKKNKLEEHMALHNGASFMYSCDKCSRKYRSYDLLKKHQNTVHAKKEHRCKRPGCNQIFDRFKELCLHQKNDHVTEYKCSECDKVFVSKSHLRLHSPVHTSFLIPCPFEKCHKSYNYQSNLVVHIRTNHMNMKFECDICKFAFKTKGVLKRHIEKMHMNKSKPKSLKKSLRRKRKDAGIHKKSMVGKLCGVELGPSEEKILLNRKPRIEVVNSSFAPVVIETI